MNRNLDPDTGIKNWFLIDFANDGVPMNKQVFWGIVVHDLKGRWIPGDWCSVPAWFFESQRDRYSIPKTAFTEQSRRDGGWPRLLKQSTCCIQAIPRMIGRHWRI